MRQVILATILLALVADMHGCVCDPAHPETMAERACSLTQIAVADKTTAPVLLVHDASPFKPDRWLAIPHAMRHALNDMTPAERAAFWTAAIAKAQELWKDQWAIAVNSEARRTQCQLHAHIGKLLSDADASGGTVVDGVNDIPVPPPGMGIWIQPDGGKLRVHNGTVAGEVNLMR